MSDQLSGADGGYTTDEMMTVAARKLKDGAVCFVGIGLPSESANLARATHAPTCVLIYDPGTIGANPETLPLSIGEGVLVEHAAFVVSVPEIFSYWLQAGRVDVGFLGGAQIDRYGNINTTVIGSYDDSKVRLPGATVDDACEATGWELRVSEKVTTTELPTDEELEVLRELHARTAAA